MTVTGTQAAGAAGTVADLEDRRSRRLLDLMVAAGVGVTGFYLERAPSVLAVVGVLAAALVLLASLHRAEDLVRRGGRLAMIGLPAFQLLLFAVVLDVFLAHGAFGLAWLLLMPIVGQAGLLLPAWGAGLVALAGSGVVAGSIGRLSGWREVPQTLIAMLSASAFVIVFSRLVAREAAALRRSEQLGAALAAANERLARYAVEAEELATTRERNRVARDIHDSVGHALTVVNVQLEAARATLDQDPARSRHAMEQAQEVARHGLAEIRRSVSSLRSSPLDGKGLLAAVRELVDGAGTAGPVLALEVSGTPRSLDARAELALFRVAQEGLTNVRRHAAAAHARVEIDFRSEDRVRLAVVDDGVGCSAPAQGFGLLGLAERLRQVGGRLELGAAETGGSRLGAEVSG